MPFAPYDWNAIVLGLWNPGILTPNGVMTLLFQAPENAELGMEVPMDTVGPLRLSYNGLVVIPGSRGLVVEPQQPNYDSLHNAIGIAKRAMEQLPLTPVTEAGFNVRYRLEGECPELISSTVSHGIDKSLEAAGFSVVRRVLSRTIRWRGGIIQADIIKSEAGYAQLTFNFDRKGDRASLIEWLSVKSSEVQEVVGKIIFEMLGVHIEGII